MEYVIGIGGLMVSNAPDAWIKTFALSSCVAITLYCPLKKAAGMIHIALPSSLGQASVPKEKLGYYANTGVPLLLKRMSETYGCLESALEINLYGGSNSVRLDDSFRIGHKNLDMVQKILKDKGLKFQMPDVGGTLTRTIEMQVSTGIVNVIAQQSNI